MCGIVGFTGQKNERHLNSLLDVIAHRGRDDRTTYYHNSVHLGMMRLAILDLTKGLYPIRHKQYVLVYNGEIYNYPELKKQLQKEGHRFKTRCDAEIILPLYEKYGIRAFAMLDGMFAISILNTRKQELILARDKAGEKPLYYSGDTDGFAFASELKAVLPCLTGHPRLDHKSAHEYFSQGYVGGARTLVRNVFKLQPAHVLVYGLRQKSLSTEPYWRSPRFDKSAATIKDGLDRVLFESVRSRMVADVPVGTFLSGGIDSSLMTKYASMVHPNIHTFSLKFPGSLRHDESWYARFAASHIGTIHHEVVCAPSDVVRAVRDIGHLIDEPISDPAFIPTMILAREAKKYVSVILSGEGADELFGGYTRYIRQLAVETVRRRPVFRALIGLLRRVWAGRRFTNIERSLSERYNTQRIWDEDEIRIFLPVNTIKVKRTEKRIIVNPLAWMQQQDFVGYLPGQLLMKVDKATMTQTLEARAPYLGVRVITLAAGLMNRSRVRFLQPKYLFRKTAGRYFPAWFVWRFKHGFTVPLSDWYRTFLKKDISALPAEVAATFGKHAGVYMHRIAEEQLTGRGSHADRIWSMMVLVRWMKQYRITL